MVHTYNNTRALLLSNCIRHVRDARRDVRMQECRGCATINLLFVFMSVNRVCAMASDWLEE